MQAPRIEKLSLKEDLTSRLIQLPTNFLIIVMGTDFFTLFWKALYKEPLTDQNEQNLNTLNCNFIRDCFNIHKSLPSSHPQTLGFKAQSLYFTA